MAKQPISSLRFNFGFLVDGTIGATRIIELDYPQVIIEELVLRPLKGEFTATRTSEGIYLEGTLRSDSTIECTRCLTPIKHSSKINLQDLVYMAVKAPPGELFVGADGLVDLAPLVRELSLLSIPIQISCQDDCLGLCVSCGQNLNESTCACEDDEIDPRFASLRALLEEKKD